MLMDVTLLAAVLWELELMRVAETIVTLRVIGIPVPMELPAPPKTVVVGVETLELDMLEETVPLKDERLELADTDGAPIPSEVAEDEEMENEDTDEELLPPVKLNSPE